MKINPQFFMVGEIPESDSPNPSGSGSFATGFQWGLSYDIGRHFLGDIGVSTLIPKLAVGAGVYIPDNESPSLGFFTYTGLELIRFGGIAGFALGADVNYLGKYGWQVTPRIGAEFDF